MAVTNVYAAQRPDIQAEGRKIGGVIAAAVRQGILTDAIVGGVSYDTLTEVKAGILALTKPVNKPWAVKVNLALDKAKAIGLLPETHGATEASGTADSLLACVSNNAAAVTVSTRTNTWF